LRAVPAFMVRRGLPRPVEGKARHRTRLAASWGRRVARSGSGRRSPVRGPRVRCALQRGAPTLPERERSNADRKEEDAMRYRGKAGALCAADAGTRRRLASDLPSLTLAAPAVSRHRKSGNDAGE